MQLQFKTKNPKQLEAASYWVDDTTEEILYGGAKGGGKSYLGASLIFADALIYPETHYFIARQELNDLRKFTTPTIAEVFKNWGLDISLYAPFNGQDSAYNIHNGSKVFLIACKEIPSDPLYERFGSMQMTRGWTEEGGEIAEAAKANLSLSIGRWKNKEYNLAPKHLITANPKKGWLKREFVDPFKQGVLPPTRKYIQAFATDNAAYLPAAYIEKLKNEKDAVRRQRLWEGRWDYDENHDALVSYDALSDLFSNTVIGSDERYLIVDVARLGRDSTVFAFWKGLELYRIETREKQGTDTTEQQAKDFAAQEHIPYSHILIDEDGIGGGVVDHLKGVKGFTANSTPIPTAAQVHFKAVSPLGEFNTTTTYTNLKTQCGFKIAELINEHQVSITVPEYREQIIEELTAQLRQKDVDTDRKMMLRPKDEVKQEIGRSPDIGDTIIMRAWYELQKNALNLDPVAQAKSMQSQHEMLERNRARIQQSSTR